MADPAPFLAAIAANPDDDLPRLVYADWLDENGDADRAEFIRLQCHTARVGPLDPTWAPAKLREFDLFKANEAKWRPKELNAESRVLLDHWRRGFPARVDLADVAEGRLTGGEWCNGNFLVSAHDGPIGSWPPVGPIRELTLCDFRPGVAELFRNECLRTVRSIRLMEWYEAVSPERLEIFLREFVRLPVDQFPELQALDVDQGVLTLVGIEALAQAPALQTVTRLSLRFPQSFSTNDDMRRWEGAMNLLFGEVAPKLECLELNGMPPFLVRVFSSVGWRRLRSLSIRHSHVNGLDLYDFSNMPRLSALMILSGDAGRSDPNPLQAFDYGWPETSLKVLALGAVPVEELRPWLAYPERFSLDFLSAQLDDRGLRMRELAGYPLTRGLKGLGGSFTTADLVPLADPDMLPDLHTVWANNTTPHVPLHWRGGRRTVIPRDTRGMTPPTRSQWCGWGDDLFS